LDSGLIKALHQEGFLVAIESNGTQPIPSGLDWVCISPKAGSPLVALQGNELKLVFPQEALTPEAVADLAFQHFLLQPMDGPDQEANVQEALAYCLAHPQWRLSLQTHKLLRIP
jgi:organic radical activating enzyme